SDLCIDCGACLNRCQMEALTQPHGELTYNADRCIGCGLCVSQCPTGAMSLVRKPASDQPKIPLNTLHTYVKMGWQRRKMTPGSLSRLALRSGIDRLRALRRK
ncbi:4Fe-4S dicluster domain-containing protein, partial [bacterium]|nr:4Fe-4S dicluster domain-containing protein [bacterium]